MRFHSIAPASLSPPLSNLLPFACSTHFCAHCTVFSFLIFRANFACFKFASQLRQAPPSFSASVVFCARHRHRQWPALLLPHSPTTPSGSLAYRVSISLSSNLGCFFFRISQAANDSDSDNYNYSAAVTRTVNCKRGRSTVQSNPCCHSPPPLLIPVSRLYFWLLNWFRAHAFYMKFSACLSDFLQAQQSPCPHAPMPRPLPLAPLERRPLIAPEKCLALQLVDNIC